MHTDFLTNLSDLTELENEKCRLFQSVYLFSNPLFTYSNKKKNMDNERYPSFDVGNGYINLLLVVKKQKT